MRAKTRIAVRIRDFESVKLPSSASAACLTAKIEDILQDGLAGLELEKIVDQVKEYVQGQHAVIALVSAILYRDVFQSPKLTCRSNS